MIFVEIYIYIYIYKRIIQSQNDLLKSYETKTFSFN
jgi:hypothetical protein